ncbi:Ribulose bisphosphate carboxylase small chain 3A [Lathyrus oleraceus]|uniref:Ribulose bisphosphate carboxylase small subunit, chloroplastic n=1 Tax=Pisum sativum TaxID=3888 RepID=A0A9D5B762_PEA|nr:Ribulose bisphosphate carboxylase small chain 3A [Pisum sativum]
MASMISSSAVTTVSRASRVQSAAVAPFGGLKSMTGFPVKKVNTDITSITSNGGRVKCMQVWPPIGKKKFETLSYLPPLTRDQLLKEVEYLLRKGWVPCLEFELEKGFVYREHNKSPGYYDGRYWTMWKLPMFGTTDASQVLKELDEVVAAYPQAFVRIIGFDNVRQVQCTVNYKHNKWYKRNSFSNAIILKLSRILVCVQ